jgi:putative FmdB family regulatory protein
MPMYRYRCTACGAHEEHLQKFSDPPLEICAACGGALAKQLTAAAFHLKGGGWYKDLYASSKPGESGGKPDAAAASSDSGAKPDAGGKSDSGGGGKPDGGGSTSSATPAASTGSTGSSSPASSSAA